MGRGAERILFVIWIVAGCSVPDVGVDPGNDVDTGDPRTEPRTIQGTVIDAAGSAIEGAHVTTVPHGFEAANLNLLISTANADPLSGMTITSGVPVDVAAAYATT